MTTPTLRGIFAPTLTPFQPDLSPDIPRWIAHCQWLLEQGCHGLCPFGTTSEANSLSVEERMEMLAQLVDAGVSPDVLMPGTGCCAIPDTVRLTRHAVELGCAGVLVLPPFYYKGVSDEGLFRTFAEIIERVGDSRLRIYLYHIPPVAQVGFSLSLIERLLKHYPSTVVGIKDSSGDWNNLHALLTHFPGFGTFTGSERFLLQTLQAGGAGAINAVANVIAAAERALYDDWQSAKAAELQQQIVAFRQAFRTLPPIPALKQILADHRGDPTWLTVRPPLVGLTEAEVAEMQAALAGSPILPAREAL
ncbi:dihydrodipicolinate synthase family protein [Litorilinea aerophila]|uniref:Dihydrodipicolinate synthase family protein n=1 Tax=Litorilinea aerophila TaxID=1204385 RepID=A0A540VLB2_9CHLR|nr:dihydrodipicolinate synthase family protein [Litorilinea aerophila]MCC9075380.1 dihydrodipicolinate synthase family protein [Litorilinea aerophila]OUC07187.1 dihydrodipicolinate synthetase [Litorilinea aerophila]